MTRPIGLPSLSGPACVLLAVAGSAFVSAQTPSETGTARIAGVVLAVTGNAPAEPGRRAIVTLTGSSLPAGRSVVTDERGRFVLDRLPAGRFMLTASKPAYFPGAYGATRPGRPGVPIVLAAGTRVPDLSITLTHGAAIGGTIRDAGGVPVFGLTVSARRVQPDGTLDQAVQAATDDRGVYRIFGLPAGDYLVSAAVTTFTGYGEIGEMTSDQIDRKLAALQARRSLPPGSTPMAAPPAPIATSTFAPVFYPHAFSPADAAKVTVAFGDDRTGTDIVLDRARTAGVDGTVSNAPAGAALAITMSQPGLSGQTMVASATLMSRPPGNGPFQFGNVTPGHFTITARTPMGARPSHWARADVDVNGDDVHGVTLTLQPALHLTGRIVFDATQLVPPADLSTIQVMLEDAMPALAAGGRGGGGRGSAVSAGATTDARGNFDVDGVLPGTWRIATSFTSDPAAWWLRSAIVNGRDVLDAPMQVDASTPLSGARLTFSDRHTVLSGALTVPPGRSASEYFIVVFPEERAMWLPRARRIQSARAGTDGTYVFRNLPPGAYRLVALTDVAPDDLIDPAFFEAILPASMRITLGEGEQKAQPLRVGGSGSN